MTIKREHLRVLYERLPSIVKQPLRRIYQLLLRVKSFSRLSCDGKVAFNTMMGEGSNNRTCKSTMLKVIPDDALPNIDISVVTFNSEKWVDAFFESLLASDYPLNKLHVVFVDNGSQDLTRQRIEQKVSEIEMREIKFTIVCQENVGFGLGHNRGISEGNSEFVLVSNIDLTFEVDALRRIVSHAVCDELQAAAWEMRQKPYEHPKIYDPISGTTNWNTHGCVLMRRQSFETIGGYSKDIFMYGEDVELSYRLRANGCILRYNPHAVVNHYSYTHENEVKPLQHSGSTLANLLIRLKFGGVLDIAMIFPLALAIVLMKPRFNGARKKHITNFWRLAKMAPQLLRQNFSYRCTAAFPFSGFDYDVTRKGAYYSVGNLQENPPKVSIITRSYTGRELLLSQAIRCVANQTYPNLEHIISEDKGETLKFMVEQFNKEFMHDVVYIGGEAKGRSAAGNAALARATGDYCVFLDDDDLLFCDHVEVLIAALLANKNARGSFSLAFDVPSELKINGSGKFDMALPKEYQSMAKPLDPEVMKVQNSFPIQAVLFERSLFEDRGGLDEDLDMLEDWALWQKYTHRTSFTYVPKTTSIYRTPLSHKAHSSRAAHLNKDYHVIVQKMNAWRDAWDRTSSH